MGSGQSSTGNEDTNNKSQGKFSTDHHEKGDQSKFSKKHPKRKKKKKRPTNNDQEKIDPGQEGKMAETSERQLYQHVLSATAAGIAPMTSVLGETPASLPQLATLNNMPKVQPKNEDDSFSLQELDAILERMRAKYRPKPVVLSGKSPGIFEELERNLANCYSKHKDQPLECSKLNREYTAFVYEQRNKLLRDVTKKDSPILI